MTTKKKPVQPYPWRAERIAELERRVADLEFKLGQLTGLLCGDRSIADAMQMMQGMVKALAKLAPSGRCCGGNRSGAAADGAPCATRIAGSASIGWRGLSAPAWWTCNAPTPRAGWRC